MKKSIIICCILCGLLCLGITGYFVFFNNLFGNVIEGKETPTNTPPGIIESASPTFEFSLAETGNIDHSLIEYDPEIPSYTLNKNDFTENTNGKPFIAYIIFKVTIGNPPSGEDNFDPMGNKYRFIDGDNIIFGIEPFLENNGFKVFFQGTGTIGVKFSNSFFNIETELKITVEDN